MALLEASNIKKIYTTDDNIAVGISDINLMFDKNEIVAITGGSGSGKSTLLRVLGGLETYEEGELYFKGLPTSHYTQEEWADYLNTNISFIFQEYNILESFTVLENVMYALTEIKSKRERKKRATEIIERVGLKDRIKAKGSQLSGGEKQRTVIARAIAKDSPIILADEPTGNLDSNTARDIIDLLKEISEDKLVVIVTHNYEDVKRITTRHIRLFDGKVELDEGGTVEHVSSQKQNPFDFKEEREIIFKKKSKKQSKGGYPSDGIALGMKRYTSRPKQNLLTTFLLIIASLLIFITCVALIPSNLGKGDILKQPGRVLIVAKDGTMFNNQSLEDFKTEFAAKDGIILDSSLDCLYYQGDKYPEQYEADKYTKFKIGYDLSYELDEGEQIKAPGEVVLKVPYTLKGKYNVGEDITLIGKYTTGSDDDNNHFYGPMGGDSNSNTTKFTSKIVGITYYLGAGVVYVDVHKESAQLLAVQLRSIPTISVVVDQSNDWETIKQVQKVKVIIDETLTGKNAKVYLMNHGVSDGHRHDTIEKVVFGDGTDVNAALKYDPLDVEIDKIRNFTDSMRQEYNYETEALLKVSQETYEKGILARLIKEASSKQISLFFNTAEEAEEACDKIAEKDGGNYLTFMAKDYKPAKQKLGMPVMVAILVAALVTLVIALSLVKIFAASKADVSIYRTMGISNEVIKGSTFVQVLMDAWPSIPIMIISYIACFFTPLGEKVNFMPIGSLIVLCLVVIGMALIVAIGFNRVIYKEKINKGLRRTNK